MTSTCMTFFKEKNVEVEVSKSEDENVEKKEMVQT
jgi:hypothetical protein